MDKLKIANFKPGTSELINYEEVDRMPGGGGGGILRFDEAALARLRISDPVLTTISLGYRNAEMVYDTLFPMITSEKMSGKFPAFGQEAFKLWNTKRALRSEVAKMEVQTGGVQMTLDEHSLGFGLDDLELHEFAGTREQLLVARQNQIDDALDLEREYSAAGLATDATLYPAASQITPGGGNWSGGGDPLVDIEAARNAVRLQIGRMPNVCVFSPTAWQHFINNQTVLDRIKYVQRGIITEEIVAGLIRIPVVKVGMAVFGTGAGGGEGTPTETALTMGNVWEQNATTGNNFVCAYTGAGWGVPSYGYTYNLVGYPLVTSYRWEIIKSQLYDSQRNYAVAITKIKAGAIIKSIA